MRLQEADWQRTLREALADPRELLRRLGLPGDLAYGAPGAFPLRVPEPYLARIRPGDPGDPLLRQVLPIAAEQDAQEGFGSDPVGDLAARQAPGLLQKYHGRALAVTTGTCAIHCRFCFRREFPYGENSTHDPARLAAALAALRDVDELILSGGDPLTLGDTRLARLLDAVRGNPRLRRIRLHTRLPVVIPARVTAALVALLAGLPQQVVVVLHVNHAQEIDSAVRAALGMLRAAGILLLNQSVLLAGVNDRVATLEQLCLALFDAGVLPYYLHQLDRVRGTAHFEVPDARAVALHRELAGRLPGYLVPRLVRELPGAASKLPLPC
jgi:EF-P beta-lysylation protein EpmB